MAESLGSNSLLGLNTKTGKCFKMSALISLSRKVVYLEDDQLHLCDIVWMYPIFGRIPNEILLTSSCCTVALSRYPPCTNKIVDSGELDDKGVVIILEEWFGF